MKLVSTFEQVREVATGRVGLVPTMGYLHEGHLRLIEAAAGACDTVVVSVFVNPLQFGDAADLDRYPRDLDRDAGLAEAAGATILVAPDVDSMYPPEAVTTVRVDRITVPMEGTHRPGHFTGVATVVAKLLAGIAPHRAYFGQKDAQQLAVVRAMARDLSFPVEIVSCPIVREPDGLALSSRNVRIPGDHRPAALTLSVGLMAGADRYEAGCRSVAEVIGAVRAPMEAADPVWVEYVELADAATAEPMSRFAGRQFLAVAARVGDVRLIDNITIDGHAGTVGRGVRLDGPSILYGRH